MAKFVIRSMDSEDISPILDISMRAWEPVFERLRPAVLPYVYDAFYPDGWRERQAHDMRHLLDTEGDNMFVAMNEGKVAGFVGLRVHPEDQMGEIYVIAVDPELQRKGIGTALIDFAMARFREAGLKSAMVETGGDPGHQGSPAVYEAAGFERWPVARYFRKV